jgi:hypothetical protein
MKPGPDRKKARLSTWLSLLDDVTVAALVAVQITYVNMLASSNHVYPFPWLLTVIVAALAAGFAIVLEMLRPHRRYEFSLAIEDVRQVKVEVSKIVRAGRPLAYWETQNPAYSSALAVVVPLLMVVVAVTAWSEVPWLSVLLALVGLALTLIYGGFRTLVTRETVTMRMGIWGIPLLNLNTADITSAELHSFAPLKDFGGYGIRFNKEMKAYFLRGNRGVKLTTRAGRKYLIGSDHSERLAAVISTIIG